MLMPGQLIKITIMGNNIQHYKQFGYDVRCKDVIYVPPEQLLPKCTKKIKVQCDVCGKIIDVIYENYNARKNRDFDICKSCIDAKRKQTCEEKYGCSYFTQTIQMKEKTKKTNMQKYGAEYISQVAEIRDKIKKTTIEKYGVENITQSDFFKEKSKQTSIKKYGVEHPMQLLKFREKVCKSMYRNSTQKTSRQQMSLYKIIKSKYNNAELNYPFSTCSLDIFICVNDIKIDVEYDGWYWHQDKQSDIRRDKFLQSNGFKTLRVRSGSLLPTEQELFDAINYLVNTKHNFKEIILSDWKEKEGQECQRQLQVVL